jgi:hypothetical protein
MDCDHKGGDLLKTIVEVPDYDGMGTDLVLRQCDYCKNFVIVLIDITPGDSTVRTLETGGWSTKK